MSETFELLVAVEDFTVLKLQLLTSVTGALLRIEKKTDSELVAFDATAKGLLLRTKGGFLAQHVAILRYIAESHDQGALLGSSDELNRAQINQWLEFSWQELGE